jgi:hypothetical protein
MTDNTSLRIIKKHNKNELNVFRGIKSSPEE